MFDGILKQRIARRCAVMFFAAALVATAAVSQAGTAVIPVPQGLLPVEADPESIAKSFIGIPYRIDGVIDENGHYTTFADRSLVFSSPGLNCSGLMLGISRFLLGRNITLDEAVRDRLGDSGPSAPGGEDWDFGWDIIMNVSEGLPRRWLLPGRATASAVGGTGATHKGYPIKSEATWQELPGRFSPGHLYLISFTDYGRLKGYGLQHYHVGLVHVAKTGEAWFYQTTGKGGRANRHNLKNAKDIAWFKRAFADRGKVEKTILVLEVDIAQSGVRP